MAYLRALQQFFYKFINSIILKYNKCTYGKNLKINGILYIKNHGGKIRFGDGVTINSGMRFGPVGGQIKTRIIVSVNGELNVGDNVGISNTTICCNKQIIIEENALIGGSCNIWDTDFHGIDYTNRNSGVSKAIKISSNSFVGALCIVLKGAIVGKGSVVGAGSVISKEIPAHQLWAGNPVRYIRELQ